MFYTQAENLDYKIDSLKESMAEVGGIGMKIQQTAEEITKSVLEKFNTNIKVTRKL